MRDRDENAVRAVASPRFGAAWIASDDPTEPILLGEFSAVRALANKRARHERRGYRRAFFLFLPAFGFLFSRLLLNCPFAISSSLWWMFAYPCPSSLADVPQQVPWPK